MDYSKGICIVAVVGLYSTMYVQGLGRPVGWVQYWVDFARPFRMPDFFLIAGLFLSRTIERPWPTYLDKKLVHFMYFFTLRSAIYFLTGIVLEAMHVSIGVVFDGEMLSGQPRWVDFLWWFRDPFKELWFIEMLPIYLLVTRLVHRVPWQIVLPLAAALQIWDPVTGIHQIDRFGERYVYFYIGYRFAPYVFAYARWMMTHRLPAIAALIAWASVDEALVLLHMQTWPGIALFLGVVGACGVIACGTQLCGSRAMDWLRYLGQNSLIVFLGFFYFVVVGADVFLNSSVIADVGTQTMIVSAIGVAGPVLLYWAVRDTRFKFLFVRPRWAYLDKPAPWRKAEMPAPAPEGAVAQAAGPELRLSPAFAGGAQGYGGRRDGPPFDVQ